MSVYPIQPSFAGGELSPSLWGRVDLAKYATGLRRCENFLVRPAGGVTRRPGLRFVARVKGGKCRLVAFQYNLDQSYVLEFGAKYVRFYMDGRQILGSDSQPYELATPYEEGELSELGVTQSADVLYLTHRKHRPMELSRLSHDKWVLEPFRFSGGPFRSQSKEQGQISLNVGDVSGTTTLSASAELFMPSDVDALFELTHHVDEQRHKEGRAATPDGTMSSESLGTVKPVRQYLGET